MTGLRDVGEAVEHALLDGVGRVAARVQENRPLAADVLESDDAYLVVFDTPGVEREDIDVDYEAGTVEVRIERFREFREGYEMRAPGRGLSLHGRADLPADADVDPAGATATLTDHGTLQVELPKRESDSDTDEEKTAAESGDPEPADSETTEESEGSAPATEPADDENGDG